jgi:MFS family permease
MTRRSPLPTAIWALGFTSLFMDISSEMIHALLPLYITGTLGAGVFALGLIEGIAEATALIVKIFSGVISDITGKRKALALLGYGMAALTKPLFPLAHSLELVITARFIDRIGKGIRGAPRDALVADLAPPERRGEAYGLRQSLDTIGAFVGPLIAMAVLAYWSDALRTVFWFAVIPAFLSVATLFFFVPERDQPRDGKRPFPISRAALVQLPRTFWLVLTLSGLLMFARVSDAFLILRIMSFDLPLVLAPLVLVAMNIIYALAAWPVGLLADRLPRWQLLALGIAALIAGALCLALASALPLAAIGLLLWGLSLALTQGVMAAMIADAAPAPLRATAFGLFNLASGVAMLLGNAASGALWDLRGASAAFMLTACVAALPLGLLPFLKRNRV